MYTDLLIFIAALAAWTFAAFLIGCWVETRRHRDAGVKEPPTARQLAFIADLVDELGGTVPSPRTRAEAATMIDDLLRERRRQQHDDDDDDELTVPPKAPPR